MRFTPPAVAGLAFFLLVGPMTTAIKSETIHIGPQDDWFGVLSGSSLRPGDEVVLAAGTYSDPRKLSIRHRGTVDRPIKIRVEPGRPATFARPDATQNTFNLSGAQYLILEGLEITGGAAGVRIGGDGARQAKFITLQGLHIHHVGGVAVTANEPGQVYQSLVFRGNHIHHTSGHGEGFYLGSNNDADGATTGYIFDSLIEGNYIHHLNGDAVSQGDGIELKDGCYNNVIRDNVIHDTNYPGILVYGTDRREPNVIERNAIWRTADHGIQAAADAIIRNNLVWETGGWGIYCRDHQSAVVGDLRIVNNTVLDPQSIRIVTTDSPGGPILVANNALGGDLRIDGRTTREGTNDPRQQIQMTNNVTGVRDRFPRTGSAVVGSADPTFLPRDDYNADPRDGSLDAGAYRYAADGNPGPPIRPGFKMTTSDPTILPPAK